MSCICRIIIRSHLPQRKNNKCNTGRIVGVRRRDSLRCLLCTVLGFSANHPCPARENSRELSLAEPCQMFRTSNMDDPKDDFKWFGEGFDGFPKRLAEDCVEYSLFIVDSTIKSQKELLTRLEAVRKEAHKLTKNLLNEYIWQRESFKLEVENGMGMPFRC